MQNKTIRVIGIDPGYERMGIAIIEKKPTGKELLIFSDCIVTSREDLHHERLNFIGKSILKIIREYKPEGLAIEKLFFNENQKTAMKVSEARGVALFIASENNLTVNEFTPLEIKVAITSYGRANKRELTAMLKRLIEIKKEIKHDDEYDAIAVALTSLAIKKELS